MIWALVATLVVGLAGAVLWWLGMRPARHRKQSRSDLPRSLKHWVEYGGVGGLLFVHHEGSARFLQFVKREGVDGGEIVFGFPDAPWSRAFYPRVREALQRHGIGSEEVPTGQEPTTRFLEVRKLSGVDEALAVVDAALEGLGLGPEATYTVHFEGPFDKVRAHEDFVERARALRGRQM